MTAYFARNRSGQTLRPPAPLPPVPRVIPGSVGRSRPRSRPHSGSRPRSRREPRNPHPRSRSRSPHSRRPRSHRSRSRSGDRPASGDLSAAFESVKGQVRRLEAMIRCIPGVSLPPSPAPQAPPARDHDQGHPPSFVPPPGHTAFSVPPGTVPPGQFFPGQGPTSATWNPGAGHFVSSVAPIPQTVTMPDNVFLSLVAGHVRGQSQAYATSNFTMCSLFNCSPILVQARVRSFR
jgi:hypothetical protein